MGNTKWEFYHFLSTGSPPNEEEESFASGSAGNGDALAARWRRLAAHFDDFVQVCLKKRILRLSLHSGITFNCEHKYLKGVSYLFIIFNHSFHSAILLIVPTSCTSPGQVRPHQQFPHKAAALPMPTLYRNRPPLPNLGLIVPWVRWYTF